MNDFIGLRKQFHPLVHNPWVGDQIQRLVAKERDERLVIHRQNELMET